MAKLQYEDDGFVEAGTRVTCYRDGHDDGAPMLATDDTTPDGHTIYECTSCTRTIAVTFDIDPRYE